MIYAIRGFSADRKYAVSKIITSDEESFIEYAALGYEPVDKETYDAVQILPQRSPTAERLKETQDTFNELLGATNNLQAAEQFRRAVQMFATSLTDEKAMEVAMIFDEWQPGVTYAVDDLVTYGTNSVGDPQLYKVVQVHTSQSDWTPDISASLFTAIGLDESGYPVWSQPTGAHDAYNVGDIVNYNNILYKSLIDGNTYSPETYPAGWKIYKEV